MVGVLSWTFFRMLGFAGGHTMRGNMTGVRNRPWAGVLTAAGLVVVGALWPHLRAHGQTLDLYTFHSPPYQIEQARMESGAIIYGTTVDTLQCIVQGMGWEANIQSVPQNRAIYGLEKQVVDGYFALDESGLLNRFAISTAPIALEKWYFFSLNPIQDYTRARVAAIAGSNEAIWLQNSHYDLNMTVSRPSQLLALLERGRVDAILMDQRVMAIQRLSAGSMRQLHSNFVRFTPLGLYLTRSFASQNPGFLEAFNRRIGDCIDGSFSLAPDEQAIIEDLARELISDLRQTVHPEYALALSAPSDDLSEILNLDTKWQTLAPAATSDTARAMLQTPASRKLAQWQARSDPLITEVMVMDRLGVTIALSVLTSDYWQGDEPKFENVANTEPETLHLGPVHFDSSSQRFQVTASMPLHEVASGRFVGAVAIGLDIEEALLSPHLTTAHADQEQADAHLR